MGLFLILLIILIGTFGYFLGKLKANKLRTASSKSLNSLNYYYGYYVAQINKGSYQRACAKRLAVNIKYKSHLILKLQKAFIFLSQMLTVLSTI